MATFMNAMTAHDYTMYPFSTENIQDYQHLMSVYLDSVFSPRLRKLDFVGFSSSYHQKLQEGWRLEHQNPLDSSTPIVFKGVVYNEMKGAFADINSLFYYRFQQALFPGTSYDHVSGGDPSAIIGLSHSDLVAFHQKNYTPQRALFYMYGNSSLEQKLDMFEANMSHYQNMLQPQESIIHQQDYASSPSALDAIQYVTVSGPPDPVAGPMDQQNRLSVTFKTCSRHQTDECLFLKVATSLLMDGAASPMHKALIESRLGSEYSVNSGFDDSTPVATVSFGLQGIKSDHVDRVHETILNVLKKVVDEGIDPSKIQNVIHRMELGLKHVRHLSSIEAYYFSELQTSD